MTTYYVVEKFNSISGRWCYMQSFEHYGEACEEMERLKRIYTGKYRVDAREEF